MKKVLLLSLLGVASCAIAENSVLPNLYLNGLSPDGRYVVSAVYGSMTILDRLTNNDYEYPASEDGMIYYEIGNGNSISDNGIIVGSTTADFDASYWKDGEWHTLYANDKYSMLIPCGITSDGSRVVGSVTNLDNKYGYDGTVIVPAYWDLKEDGTYADPVLLPHPELDFAGSRPQYITALCVAPDGNTIVGQVQDYSGAITQPIVYRYVDGEWSYTLPASDLINPDHIELPAFRDYPEMPQPEAFMNPENKALYEKDYNAYVESGYSEELYPDPLMYLTAEETEKYDEALAAYDKEAEIYNAWIDEYYTLWDEVLLTSTSFTFNNLRISPDGTKFVTAAQVDGESMWSKSYIPYVFDLTTDEYTAVGGGKSVFPTQIFNNGAILAYDAPTFGSTDQNSYFKAADSDTFEPIYQYMLTTKPEVAEWMKDNMCHDVLTYDEEWNEVLLEDEFVGGFVLATENFSTLAFGVQVNWETEEENVYYYTYIIQDDLTGVENVTVGTSASEVAVTSRPGGVIEISGDAASLDIYDTNGRLLFSVDRPTGSIATGLPSGLYIVKTLSLDGTPSAAKLTL